MRTYQVDVSMGGHYITGFQIEAESGEDVTNLVNQIIDDEYYITNISEVGEVRIVPKS